MHAVHAQRPPPSCLALRLPASVHAYVSLVDRVSGHCGAVSRPYRGDMHMLTPACGPMDCRGMLAGRR